MSSNCLYALIKLATKSGVAPDCHACGAACTLRLRLVPSENFRALEGDKSLPYERQLESL